MEAEAKILQAIFDQAALGIAQISVDGSWLRVNDRYCQMLGYSEAELLTRKIWDVTRPGDYDEVSSGRRQLLAGEISSHSMDKRYIRKDGTVFWGRLNRSLVRDHDNQPLYFICVVEDITNRKQAEEALRESEKRFRVAFYRAAVGIAQTGADGQWLFVNDKYCEMFGYSQTELRGKNFLDITHPDDSEASRTALRQLLAGEISSLLKEKRYIRKDGGTLWARLFTSLVRDQHDQPQYFISVLEDITEQKLMEERLRESEGHLKNAARLAHVGHWQWDIQTNRVSGSEEMFRIFGKPPDYTPTFDDFLQTVIPQERERVARWVSNCLAEKRGSDIEYQIAWPNGDLRTVSCISELSFGEDGLPTRMFGACQDITVVKKNEAKLVQAQEDLRALTARLVELQELGMKELARELHDDLSQNLAAVGMEIETLLPPSAQPSRSFSEQVHEVWRRVTKLARDVHSMSQRLHPAILDELGLKEALSEQCWAFSERTGIPVKFESAGESKWPGADVSLCFYRIAQEGLHNISKHAGATSVHLTLFSSEEECTLRIEDNGQGFEPREAKGKNALGLISMRERARLVNGSFTIRSEYGKGTMLEVSVALKTN